ncbi:MAG TPA: type IX secretion system membrane protein PorP/SprF, partial [Sphingobacteriaceae bacterium]
TGLYRHQWSGLEGAPRTTTVTFDAPFSQKRFGAGLQVFQDKLGITETSGAVVSYAYRIRMEKSTLSFGLQGTAGQFKSSLSSVILEPGGGSNDPAFRNDVNEFFYNFGTGVYYNSDRFYAGLSSPQFLNKRVNDSTSTTSTYNVPHLFLATGYVFPLGTDFNLKPSFLIKAVKGAPIQGDVNLTLWIKDAIAIGAQYRSSADVAGMVELQATPQIRLGYSYDYSITSLRNYNSGSHEIMLRYEFGYDRQKFISPRYF